MKLQYQLLSRILQISVTLTILFLFLHNNYLDCMQKNDLVMLKLKNENKYEIPFHLALLSNTIHKKYWLKKQLAVDTRKPIFVSGISTKEMSLFESAVSCSSETTFNTFFEGLISKQQKRLMSIAGPDKLDSPHLTALITQAYLPQELLHSHIIPYLDKAQIEQYMRCATIAHNASQPILYLSQVLLDKYQIITHPNGMIHHIPTEFDAGLCTRNVTYHINDPAITIMTYAYKTIGQHEYWITAEKNDHGNIVTYLTLFQKGSDQQKKIVLHEDEIYTILCSPDGQYISMILPKKKNNLVLVSIDADTAIIKKKILDTTLDRVSRRYFSHNSTVLFCLSYNNGNDGTSRLFIYDIAQERGSIITSKTCLSDMSINHNTSRMLVVNSRTNTRSELGIWNIESPLNPFVVGCIDIFDKHSVSALQYNNHSNTCAARLSNGNIFLIEESPSGTIKLSHMINPHKCSEPFNLRGLLFTPDDKILIDHSRHDTEDNDQHYIRVWDVESACCIMQNIESVIDTSIAPEIVIRADGRSFLVNIYYLWCEYKLYHSAEEVALSYIHENRSVFTLYLLHRLYQAHKNNEPVMLHENDAINTMLQVMPTTPCNIQAYIKEYLLTGYKKSLLETIQTDDRWGGLFNACVSLYEQLFKK